jgi:F420-dependent oxidoreductase-like protein
MRFAFKTAPQHTTWPDMLAVWEAADDIDVFESGWTFDHFYPIFSDPTGPCLEGWATLTALAQATRRLRLGVLVTGIPYRQPAAFANLVATVDIISGGRLELGIGAGWNEQESDAYGIELGSLRQRSDRFEEACEVLVRLLGPAETASFDGSYYRLRDARCSPKPVQQPHPPICIGGSGERRTLRTAARFAQHWNYVGGTVEEFRHKVEVLHQHCAEVGRDPSEIELSTHIRLPASDDLGEMTDQIAAFADAGLDLAVIQLPPPHRPDVLEPLAKALAQVA